MDAKNNPLMEAGMLLDAVTAEFRKLVRAFDPSWAPGEFPRGTQLRVSTVALKYKLVWDTLSECSDFINGEWTDIEKNSARCHEVSMFLHSYKGLISAVLELDDKCINDEQRCDEVFSSSTVVMDYIYMLSVFDKQLGFVDQFLSGATKPREEEKSKYAGLADKLMFHIAGIDQTQLENFIERDEFPLLVGSWIGSKRDATYFGHYFGKECWQMNRVFSFSTEGNGKARLHYKQNSDENVKTTDPIYQILKDYPRKKKARKM